MLHSFIYYISRGHDQDLSVSTETTQQMHQLEHQAEYYEKTVYNILEKDIGMILPRFGNTESDMLSK